MAHLLGREFEGVTIATSEHFWGLAIMMPLRPSEEDLANIDSPVPHVPPRLRRIIEENIMILLAGAIAEELVEPRSGRYEDPTPRPRIVAEDVAKDEKLSARARQKIVEAASKPGLSDEEHAWLLSFEAFGTLAAAHLEWMRVVTRAQVLARDFAHRVGIVAEALMEHTTLSSAEVERLLDTERKLDD